MKASFAVIFFLILTFACVKNPGSETPIKLAQNEVNSTQMMLASDYASGLLSNWISGVFNPIDESKVSSKLAKNLSPESQKAISEQQINPNFGRFIQLVYVETYKSSKEYIYRFKGVFERGEPEVRISVDKDNKVSGFLIAPWTNYIPGSS
jgi:hypothetical protein